MISLHCGNLGVGKTYWATTEVYRLIHRGIDCYVNWKIDFTEKLKKDRKSWIYRKFNKPEQLGNIYSWTKLEDLYSMKKGEVFFDEAHQKISARKWEQIPEAFIRKLTLSRHYGLNMHFISQHSQQVDVVVRRLANEYVLHTRFWKIMRTQHWDGAAIEILANPVAAQIQPPKTSAPSGYRFMRKDIGNSYNSWETPEEEEEWFKQNSEVKLMWSPIEATRLLEQQKAEHKANKKGSQHAPSLTIPNMKGGDLHEKVRYHKVKVNGL